MGRRKGERIELGGDGRLTHSPFAALRKAGEAGPLNGGRAESAPDATPPPDPDRDSKRDPDGRIEVRRERKGRGGKTVTLVRWLHGAPDADSLASLARDLASALGAGARVEGPATLVVQGDQVERAIRALQDRGLTERITRGTDGP